MNGSSGQPSQPNQKSDESVIRRTLMKYRIVMILIGILFIVIAIGYVVHTGSQIVAAANVPSEEKCARLYGFDLDTLKYAQKWWCEMNETGWHFNKTWFRESLKEVT